MLSIIADARRIILRASLVVVSAVLVVNGSAGMVSAQDAADSKGKRESITLSPTKRIYTEDRGKVINDKLTILNDGETDYDFIAYARPYSVADSNYNTPNFDTPVKNADLYKWVRFEQVRYHAKAHETIYVPYTINIPENAAPGGHYGAIFAEIQVDNAKQKGSALARTKRVGMLTYLTVNGSIVQAGTDKGVSIPFWQAEPPMIASTTLKNDGNVHIDETVVMTVRDVLGNIKYRSSKDIQVLPDTERVLDSEWEKSPWFGLFKVEVERKFLDKTQVSSGYVLMMPRFIPFITILLLIMGGVHAIYGRSRKVSKKGYRR